MKKYDTNKLYLVKLDLVTSKKHIDYDYAEYWYKFNSYAVVRITNDGYFETKYQDILSDRVYSTKMSEQGQVFVNPEFLQNLSEITTKETVTINEIKEILDIAKIINSKEGKAKELEIYKLLLSMCIEKYGKKDFSMMINKLVDELGIKNKEEILSMLFYSLGFDRKEKEKNITRIRK